MRAGVWLGALTLVGFVSAHEIVGKNEICSNEGEIVNVKNWKLDLRCFTCMCKNGYVQCQKEPCPSLEGCHLLLDVPKGQCCRRCKGCTHRGIEWESGSEWRDTQDPCRVLTCRAGVITATQEKCYVPCHNPMPPAPGQCCPTCIGCRVNGQTVSSGRVVRSLEDPCLKCQCTNGRLSCSKRACSVLHCHPRSILPPRPGECCPSCAGSRSFTIPPQGRCLLGSDVHPPGRSFKPDKCTTCECMNGTNLCERVSCPVLDCPPEEQILAPGGCCSHCLPRISPSTVCTYEGLTYKEGESWQVDLCKSCVCSEGVVRCAVEMCPNTNIPCPPNHKLVEVAGQCCPKCVESDGVCTVFGDPHYRTFDGKFYSFQGSCKYQLAADCVNHTFSIRVTNDARDTRISSWTKTVSIKLNGMKINLGEKRRVKINGERVSVPEFRDGVTVTETEDSVLVETQPVGLKVLWDGNSFLEISVPASYKGRLCGLCGNFNYISRDDMTTRTGRIVNDPDKFGNSWRVGGKKACSRGFGLEHIPSHRCSKYTLHRRQKEKKCKILKSRVFEPCHKHLSHLNYFKSCIVDMCECPREKLCFCESFTAYAHECARLGVSLPNWRRETGCVTRH